MDPARLVLLGGVERHPVAVSGNRQSERLQQLVAAVNQSAPPGFCSGEETKTKQN